MRSCGGLVIRGSQGIGEVPKYAGWRPYLVSQNTLSALPSTTIVLLIYSTGRIYFHGWWVVLVLVFVFNGETMAKEEPPLLPPPLSTLQSPKQDEDRSNTEKDDEYNATWIFWKCTTQVIHSPYSQGFLSPFNLLYSAVTSLLLLLCCDTGVNHVSSFPIEDIHV